MEEWDFSAVGRGCVGWTDDVVVGAEEAVHPGVLGSAAEVLEVVHRTVEAGVTVLGAAAE